MSDNRPIYVDQMTGPIATKGQLDRMLGMVPPVPGSGPCIIVTTDDKGVVYRGCAVDADGGTPWTDRWARLVLRDDPRCERPCCYDLELSDGTRAAGEMDFSVVDRRCMEWVAWGKR